MSFIEIKKAVNSNLNKPLDVLIRELLNSEDNGLSVLKELLVEAAKESSVNEVRSDINNSTYGLSVLKSLLDNTAKEASVDEVEGLLKDESYGLNAIKKSVSDGKTSVANAITGKGIETATDATFATMAENINNIQVGSDVSGVTASASDVLSGKVIVDANGQPLTGTMTKHDAKTESLDCGGSYTIPEGYHNGSGKVTANSLSSQTGATASASDIASGKTAWVNGSKLTGTASSGYKYATGGIPMTVTDIDSSSSYRYSLQLGPIYASSNKIDIINTGLGDITPKILYITFGLPRKLYIVRDNCSYVVGNFMSSVLDSDLPYNNNTDKVQFLYNGFNINISLKYINGVISLYSSDYLTSSSTYLTSESLGPWTIDSVNSYKNTAIRWHIFY